MTAFIFADCAVLDGTRNERREDHHVLVEGGHIREVSDRPIKSASAETIELARPHVDAGADRRARPCARRRRGSRPAFGPAGYALDLAGGQGARGHAAARLYDDPRCRGGRWRARRSGRGGPRARAADLPVGHGAEPDGRPWRHQTAHAAGRHLRVLRGRAGAVAHRRRGRRVPPCGARRAAQRGDADQDRGLGRRRLTL